MPLDNREDLQFFGRICASVSHDIKNVLAVVNEGAGLLSDLSIMAEKGMPLEPEKLRSVAGSIQNQIRRGDGIIKDLNTFAHSVDEPVGTVNLAEVITLVAALAKRLAAAKCVTLEAGECADALVRTEVYGLEYLLHGMVTHSLARAGDGGTLTFSCRPEDGGAVVSLCGPGLDSNDELPGTMTALAAELGMAFRAEPANRILELAVPEKTS
ncbi:HAMP domain-containing histidine kinase [Salidesulfovibrio onnuriiensis]|uniref:HAMP domain-containing histidine kinase n=1 Tax=Salidesulfovibrio onnuriiensis TaxID=2583823 RepID=UPI0011C80271|nr:HAMP domain-containing histidine kinase [Salidesulfovibrio onnuriiensis]